MKTENSYRLLNLDAEIVIPPQFKLITFHGGTLYNLITPEIKDDFLNTNKGTCLILYHDISNIKGKININKIDGKILEINHNIAYNEGKYDQFNVIRKIDAITNKQDNIDLFFIIHYKQNTDVVEEQIHNKTALITHINGTTKVINIKDCYYGNIDDVSFNEGNIYILHNNILTIVDIENEIINNLVINVFISKPSLKYDNGMTTISEKI